MRFPANLCCASVAVPDSIAAPRPTVPAACGFSLLPSRQNSVPPPSRSPTRPRSAPSPATPVLAYYSHPAAISFFRSHVAVSSSSAFRAGRQHGPGFAPTASGPLGAFGGAAIWSRPSPGPALFPPDAAAAASAAPSTETLVSKRLNIPRPIQSFRIRSLAFIRCSCFFSSSVDAHCRFQRTEFRRRGPKLRPPARPPNRPFCRPYQRDMATARRVPSSEASRRQDIDGAANLAHQDLRPTPPQPDETAPLPNQLSNKRFFVRSKFRGKSTATREAYARLFAGDAAPSPPPVLLQRQAARRTRGSGFESPKSAIAAPCQCRPPPARAQVTLFTSPGWCASTELTFSPPTRPPLRKRNTFL